MPRFECEVWIKGLPADGYREQIDAPDAATALRRFLWMHQGVWGWQSFADGRLVEFVEVPAVAGEMRRAA